MEANFVVNALGLALMLSIPIVVAALVGGVVASVLRAVTQIDDQIVSFVGRLLFVSLVVYLFNDKLSGDVFAFADRLWGGADTYL